MTLLTPSVHQHLWHVKKLVQKCKLASLFGVKFIVKIIVMQLSLVQLTAKVYLTCIKWWKPIIMCYYESE